MGTLIKKLEKYQSDLGENAPKIFLNDFYDLNLNKVPKKKDHKTPDYEILNKEGKIIAICEVKSFLNILPIENMGEESSFKKLDEISQRKDLNHRSKLIKANNTAMNQFIGYNHLPKVIVFSSFDMTDHIDMHNALQDQISLYPDSILADVYILVKIHQSIMPSDIFQIKESITFVSSNETGKKFLEKYCEQYGEIKTVGLLPLTFKVN